MAQSHDQGGERRAGERDDDRDPFASVDDTGNDPRKIVDLQEQAREATVFLERLLELMGEKATIEPAESDDPETLELNIKGDGSGILIGRHGQTLDAIEYMVKSAARAQDQGRRSDFNRHRILPRAPPALVAADGVIEKANRPSAST